MALRIATFNLENLDDRLDLQPPLPARLPTLRAQLERLQADIVCLQEVNAQKTGSDKQRHLDALDQLLGKTRYASFNRVWTRDEHGKGALNVHNLVILSRHPITAYGQLWHDLVPPPAYHSAYVANAGAMTLIRWDRPLLHAEVQIGGGRRLHVINVHLRAPRAAFVRGQKQSASRWASVPGWAEGLFAAAMKHAGQALEARLFVERLLDGEEDAMIAVCGDFNAETAETPTRIVRGDPEDIGNPDLSARALVALDTTATDAGRYSVIHGPRREMLDHILVSKSLALRCRKIEIDNVGLLDETKPELLSRRRLGSYHAPLVAEFDLP